MKKLPLIINLRGNSGSGKSTLTRSFLNSMTQVLTVYGERNRITGYTGYYKNRAWAIVGSYENACGGCDGIKTQKAVTNLVENFTKRNYNVWLEGLLMSTIYGEVGAYSEKFGNRWIFAYLSTPAALCLERIKERRLAAGNEKPLNEANTVKRFGQIVRSCENIMRNHRRRVIILPVDSPLQPLLKIIKEEGA